MAPTRPPGPDVLVVTGSLRAEPGEIEDRAVAVLAADVAALAPDATVTVAVLDGYRSGPAAGALADRGVTVETGPRDWAAWAGADALRWSHVIVAQSALGGGAPAWVDATQPQAARVLFVASRAGLGFRALEALRATTPGAERDGLAAVTRAAEVRLGGAVEAFDAVWCERPDDADWAAGRHPKLAVAHLPPVLPHVPGPPGGPGGRSGLAVLADRMYDASGAEEALVLRTLKARVPRLRRFDPGLTVVVLTDDPSPRLAAVADAAGVEFRASRTTPEVLAGARVMLDDRPGGSEASLRWALATTTPIVLAAGAERSDEVVDGALRSLLADDTAWAAARADLVERAGRRHDRGERGRRLGAALAGLGIDPSGSLAEPFALRADAAPWRQVSPPLRPTGYRPPAPGPRCEATDRDERYRRWAEERGPTPATLAALRAERPALAAVTTFSVAVPVGAGTDGLDLEETLRSLRAQVHPEWEVVLAAVDPAGEETARTVAQRSDAPAAVPVAPVAVAATPVEAAVAAALEVTGGDFVAVVAPGDTLKPHALAQMARWLDAQPRPADAVYADEDLLDDGALRELPAKPDWSPTTLLAEPYIGRMLAVRRAILARVPGLLAVDGSGSVVHDASMHDLALRVAEVTDAIAHVPEPLLTRTAAPATDAAATALTRRVVAAALRRRGSGATVDEGAAPGRVRPRFGPPGTPRVAVVVPTHNARALLLTALASVLEVSTYPNLEVVVVDNRSDDPDILADLAGMPGRVIRYPYPFNYARMMNLAAAEVGADVVVFLNNDTEVIAPDWVEAMLEHALRPEVGAVGARLHYAGGASQHEGILLGAGGWAHNLQHGGLWSRGETVRDTSAVTGACLMMRTEVFARVGGNDETLRIAYNDVDLCLRVRQAGYQVVYTPHARLYHYESATRGSFEHPEEAHVFEERWRVKDLVDPYYGPMFVQRHPFFRLDV